MNKLIEGMRAETNVGRTANGGRTNKSSLNDVLDLFFLAGASRGKNLESEFLRSLKADEDVTIRLLLWMRDAREGAGERKLFRDLLGKLIRVNEPAARAVLARIPDLGRWDDVFVAFGTTLQSDAVFMIQEALKHEDGLCAKWMPRKGELAVTLRRQLGWTPKQYRKTLVNLSDTVEQKMCAREWDKINFSHVPSVAFSRYKKAFDRHVPGEFEKFVKKVERGEEKVNAGAIYPYQIVKEALGGNYFRPSATVTAAIDAQWKALPNFLEGSDERMIVVADTSGSMFSGASPDMRPIDVSVSLALYLSERMEGPFKDTFITFSDRPTLQRVTGSLSDRINQVANAEWGYSTNVEAVFRLILDTAKKHKVPASEMPTKIVIISDMEFNACTRNVEPASLAGEFKKLGYQIPELVFWNVNGRSGNVPTTTHQKHVALVSGASPSIVKSVLGGDILTPMEVMLKTLMQTRYDY